MGDSSSRVRGADTKCQPPTWPPNLQPWRQQAGNVFRNRDKGTDQCGASRTLLHSPPGKLKVRWQCSGGVSFCAPMGPEHSPAFSGKIDGVPFKGTSTKRGSAVAIPEDSAPYGFLASWHTHTYTRTHGPYRKKLVLSPHLVDLLQTGCGN